MAAMGPGSNPEERSSARLPWLVGALGVLTVLSPSWLLGWVPVRGDSLVYFWPLRERLAAALSRGELPLYDLLCGNGAPLLLNPQTGALYPPHLLYAVAPVSWVLAWLHAGHLLLLTAGCGVLLRRLGYRGAPAVIGALTVGLGGAMLSASAMQDKLYSLAWAPWLLASVLALVHRECGVPAGAATWRPGAALGAIAPAAMMVLAGGLDMVVMAGLLALLAAAWDGGRRPLGSVGALWRGAAAVGCLAAAAGLTAVVWWPFWEWRHATTPGAFIATDVLMSRSLSGSHLLGLISPNAGYRPEVSEVQLPWSTGPTLFYLPGLYAGGAGLVLGLAGLVRGLRRPGAARWAAAGALVAGGLAVGSALPPVAWCLQNVPVLDQIRYPQKWALIGALVGAVLVAEGARWVVDAGRVALAPRRLGGATLLGGVVLVVIGGVGRQLGGEAGAAWWDLVFAAGAAVGLGGVVVQMLLRAGPADRGPANRGSARARARWAALAVALVLFDLAVSNGPLAPVRPPGQALATPPVVALLTAQPGPVRVFPYSYLASGMAPPGPQGPWRHEIARESLLPGVASAYGLAQPYGWLIGQPAAVQEHFVSLGREPLPQRIHELRLAGVTHLLANTQQDAESLAATPGVRRLADGLVQGPATTLEVLAIDGPLPDARWVPAGDAAAVGRPLEGATDSGHRYEATVDAPLPGQVVWLRPHDPYWLAWVDGEPVATAVANGYQLAVLVPAGEHVVRLEYRVPALAVGGGISGGFALVLLGFALGAVWWWRRRGGSDRRILASGSLLE